MCNKDHRAVEQKHICGICKELTLGSLANSLLKLRNWCNVAENLTLSFDSKVWGLTPWGMVSSLFLNWGVGARKLKIGLWFKIFPGVMCMYTYMYLRQGNHGSNLPHPTSYHTYTHFIHFFSWKSAKESGLISIFLICQLPFMENNNSYVIVSLLSVLKNNNSLCRFHFEHWNLENMHI